MKKNAPKNITIIIIGNKSDLSKEREVSEQEINSLIKGKYFYYY